LSLVLFQLNLGDVQPEEFVGAHKFLWLDITEIQLKQNQGQRVIHVVTSGGSRDFVL